MRYSAGSDFKGTLFGARSGSSCQKIHAEAAVTRPTQMKVA